MDILSLFIFGLWTRGFKCIRDLSSSRRGGVSHSPVRKTLLYNTIAGSLRHGGCPWHTHTHRTHTRVINTYNLTLLTRFRDSLARVKQICSLLYKIQEPNDGDVVMLSAVMLGTSLNKDESPCVTPPRAPVFIKVAPKSHLASCASPFLQSLRSAHGRQNGCSCARTHPQERLSDVNDWKARPMSCRHWGYGESGEGV